MKLAFGKHKGKDVRNVPKDYLMWLVENRIGGAPLLSFIDGVLNGYRGIPVPLGAGSKAKQKKVLLDPSLYDADELDAVLAQDSRTRAVMNSLMAEVVMVYTDGGICGMNPSDIGGSWAWCALSRSGERVVEDSGVLEPEPMVRELHRITNNHTELLAALEVLAVLPDGWNGDFITDSNVTRLRLLAPRVVGANVPPLWMARAKHHLERLGKLTISLVAGHPSEDDLTRGIGSAHNVWCDERCTVEATALMNRKKSKVMA